MGTRKNIIDAATMKLCALALVSSLAVSAAFVPSTGVNRLSSPSRLSGRGPRNELRMADKVSVFPPPASIFEAASESINSQNQQLAKYGFGATAKAERWNGRHAMFGWFAIILTGYAKSHNLIPNAD